MAVLQVAKIQGLLQKALKVGYVEEGTAIAGVPLVISSLRPEDFIKIHEETKELEDIAYVNAYREEHLCRAIVEIAGVNLRDVDIVEVEGIDQDGKVVIKKVERHAFMKDHILRTWSRDAQDAAFTFFNQVADKSEKLSSAGVQVDTAGETDEEKYRRLLSELKEVEGHLPMDLSARLLSENGYSKWTTSQDFEAATQILDQTPAQPLDREEELPPPPAPAPAPPPPPPRPAPVAPPPAPQVQRSAPPPTMQEAPPSFRMATPEDLMRARKPLTASLAPEPAQPLQPAEKMRLTRSQQIALEEGLSEEEVAAMAPPRDLPTLQPTPTLDPGSLGSILDAPPRSSVNSRFRPPPSRS